MLGLGVVMLLAVLLAVVLAAVPVVVLVLALGMCGRRHRLPVCATCSRDEPVSPCLSHQRVSVQWLDVNSKVACDWIESFD